MYCQYFCFTILICVLNQANADEQVRQPSIIGSILRMGGNLKYQLADSADDAVSTLRGIFRGSSDAVIRNARRVGTSVDKSLESTDTFVRGGLNAGRDYLDSGYTIISTPVKTTNDVFNNVLDELKVSAPAPPPPPQYTGIAHLEFVDEVGNRKVLTDQEVQVLILEAAKALKTGSGA